MPVFKKRKKVLYHSILLGGGWDCVQEDLVLSGGGGLRTYFPVGENVINKSERQEGMTYGVADGSLDKWVWLL